MNASATEKTITTLADYALPPNVILAVYCLREHNTGTEAVAAIRTLYRSEIPTLIITGSTLLTD